MSHDGQRNIDAPLQHILFLFLITTQSLVSSNVLLQFSRTTLYYVAEVNSFFSLSSYST